MIYFYLNLLLAILLTNVSVQAPAKRQVLPGQNAPFATGVLHLLVGAVEKADLAPAHADIARRDVRQRADVPGQLHHEGLAEAEHLRGY